MQTAPGHAKAYRRTITQQSDPNDGAELAPQTPAERIALPMALLNRGPDLLDGVVRKSLAGCARGGFAGHRDVALPCRPTTPPNSHPSRDRSREQRCQERTHSPL